MGHASTVIIGDTVLSLAEKDELGRQEAVIDRGLRTFVEVGSALAAIRDGKLYRSGYATFEEYCRERWGFARNYANKMIAAAEVVTGLGTVVPNVPVTERHARPLTTLPPEAQARVWQEAVETAPNGKVTAAHVQRVVNEFRTPPAPVIEPQAATPTLAVHFSSETPEHYTPDHIIEAVVECLGEIDLDPCADAGHRVPAKLHYEKRDNGLAHDWHGRVYMNPPYGREIDMWVRKLTYQHEKGNVTEAIALLPARVDTQWWQLIRDYPVCFVTGRLTFIGNDDPAPFPSAIVYLGNDIGWFWRVFHRHHQLGDVWQRLEEGMFGE